MQDEPLYRQTTAAMGWSPEDLDPPFDLTDALRTSYRDKAPSHSLPQELRRPVRA